MHLVNGVIGLPKQVIWYLQPAASARSEFSSYKGWLSPLAQSQHEWRHSASKKTRSWCVKAQEEKECTIWPRKMSIHHPMLNTVGALRPYAHYYWRLVDWKSAYAFLIISESWSTSQRLMEDWRFCKAALRSNDWSTLKAVIHARQDLSKGFRKVKALRHQKTTETMANKRFDQTVIPLLDTLAVSMNQLETLTGLSHLASHIHTQR